MRISHKNRAPDRRRRGHQPLPQPGHATADDESGLRLWFSVESSSQAIPAVVRIRRAGIPRRAVRHHHHPAGGSQSSNNSGQAAPDHRADLNPAAATAVHPVTTGSSGDSGASGDSNGSGDSSREPRTRQERTDRRHPGYRNRDRHLGTGTPTQTRIRWAPTRTRHRLKTPRRRTPGRQTTWHHHLDLHRTRNHHHRDHRDHPDLRNPPTPPPARTPPAAQAPGPTPQPTNTHRQQPNNTSTSRPPRTSTDTTTPDSTENSTADPTDSDQQPMHPSAHRPHSHRRRAPKPTTHKTTDAPQTFSSATFFASPPATHRAPPQPPPPTDHPAQLPETPKPAGFPTPTVTAQPCPWTLLCGSKRPQSLLSGTTRHPPPTSTTLPRAGGYTISLITNAPDGDPLTTTITTGPTQRHHLNTDGTISPTPAPWHHCPPTNSPRAGLRQRTHPTAWNTLISPVHRSGPPLHHRHPSTHPQVTHHRSATHRPSPISTTPTSTRQPQSPARRRPRHRQRPHHLLLHLGRRQGCSTTTTPPATSTHAHAEARASPPRPTTPPTPTKFSSLPPSPVSGRSLTNT